MTCVEEQKVNELTLDFMQYPYHPMDAIVWAIPFITPLCSGGTELHTIMYCEQAKRNSGPHNRLQQMQEIYSGLEIISSSYNNIL